MLDLAMRYDEKHPIVMRAVAERQEVSKKYLDNLFSVLRAAGLVRSERGAAGGYTLARPPEEIHLGEIVQALEGSLAVVDCVDDELYCHKTSRCSTHCIWGEVTRRIREALDGVTLASLAKQQLDIEARLAENAKKT
jgi:Rrf2 family protein